MEMKPARIEARIRNNVLYHCIFDNYDSVAEFCRKEKFHTGELGSILNLMLEPKNKKTGEYRTTCRRLSRLFKILPEDLFPNYLYYELEKNKLTIELSYDQLPDIDRNKLLIEDSPEDLFLMKEGNTRLMGALDTLSPRQKKVIEMRFGLKEESSNLEAIAKSLSVTRERVRQIEEKAIRKMRHPATRKLYN